MSSQDRNADPRAKPRSVPPTPSDTDLAQDKMGNNRLQADEQEAVRNERRAEPDVRDEADTLGESFDKLDKDVRSEADLGKGNRRAG